MSFHWIDFVIIGVLGLFGLMGFVKGLTNRVLSLLSWGGSFVGAAKVGPFLRPWIHSHISSDLGATLLTYGGLFVLFLVLLKALTHTLSQMVQKGPFKILDRLLGMGFSLFFGFLILVTLGTVCHLFLPKSYYPSDLNKSSLYPWILEGQDRVEHLSPLKAQDFKKASSFLKVSPPTRSSSKEEDLDYEPKERSALSTLIQKNM